VIGIYEAKNKDYDGLYAFTSLETAQQLFVTDRAHGFDLRLNSIDEAEETVDDLRSTFGDH
jgi:ABC-type lipoprotein release transport system permease subunit